MKLIPFYFVAIFAVCGCDTSGSMEVTSYDSKSNKRTAVTYTKYFDGAEWLLTDKLGIAVAVDNDTPISRQILGGLSGDDSFADGSIAVYFWNLGPETYKIRNLALKLDGDDPKQVQAITVGAGPFVRTRLDIGSAQFFSYATKLIASVTIELDGQTIHKTITVVRRTDSDLKLYWGTPGNFPPYPWFTTKLTSSWSDYSQTSR